MQAPGKKVSLKKLVIFFPMHREKNGKNRQVVTLSLTDGYHARSNLPLLLSGIHLFNKLSRFCFMLCHLCVYEHQTDESSSIKQMFFSVFPFVHKKKTGVLALNFFP